MQRYRAARVPLRARADRSSMNSSCRGRQSRCRCRPAGDTCIAPVLSGNIFAYQRSAAVDQIIQHNVAFGLSIKYSSIECVEKDLIVAIKCDAALT